MDSKSFQPFVPASQSMPELTLKAIIIGVLMALVLGAANAYLGMKAGLTVAATFPAAVVAIAALRPLKGTVLEENIARTTASVGEALVAGAIFTLPAFVISGVWEELDYFYSTAIMLIGGTLGVLFVIVLRRTLVVEADLPFPESVAAAEIVKAGQGGETGAKYVFGAMGLAGLWELLKNSHGLKIVEASTHKFFAFKESTIEFFRQKMSYSGGLLLESPAASPALMGVGFIVGPRVAAVLFSGALLGWLLLVPLAIFLNPSLAGNLAEGKTMVDLSFEVWMRQIRPLAVGTMIVAAFYTLWGLRTSLITGIRKAFGDFSMKGGNADVERTEIDLNLKKVFIAIAVLSIPMFFLYDQFSGSIGGSLMLTVVMIVLGFLFTAVAGYLVGMIGSSNNPISGLTLSTLLISAILMVALGVTGAAGVMAVLAIAGVICTAAGIAGDMMQDLKVGHIIGGTPWRMQIAEIIGVIVAALVLAFPLAVLDKVYHIGSAELPAPQAGLMALMAQGIVGGEMAWPLVIVGMFFGVGLVLIKAPSPMLIAVGMYLPFESTAAIYVGGIIRWILQKQMDARKASAEEQTRAENVGVLISSGLIAGEALMAVILAFWFLGQTLDIGIPGLPHIADNYYVGLLIYPVMIYLLVMLPLKKMKERGIAATKIE